MKRTKITKTIDRDGHLACPASREASEEPEPQQRIVHRCSTTHATARAHTATSRGARTGRAVNTSVHIRTDCVSGAGSPCGWRHSFILALMVTGSCAANKGSAPAYAMSTTLSTGCRYMRSLSAIPTGYHPSSVQWTKNDPRGDLVCLARTEGPAIRFVPWLDFPMPPGYYVLYEYPNPSINFNGCRRWTIFNGQYTCRDMYPQYELRLSTDSADEN